MKKLLLSLAVVLGFMSASAADVKIDFSSATYLPTAESAEASVATDNGVTMSFVNCKKGAYSGQSYLQISGKTYSNAAWVDLTPSFETKSIVLHTGSNGSVAVTVAIYVGETEICSSTKLETKDADFTFAIPASYQAAGTTYRLKTTNKYNAQLTSLTFSAEGGVPDPEPTPEPEVKEVADFAEVIALNNTADKLKVNTPVTVVYNNGTRTWMVDSKGNPMLMFGSLADFTNAENGTTFASVNGKYSPYNKLPEMVPASVGEKSADLKTVEAEELAIEELSFDMVNKYVKLVGCSISEVNGKNATITDETGSVASYNNLTNVTVAAGTGYTIYGFVGCYNTTLQIQPILIDASAGVETVATPTFSVAEGEVTPGTAVAISCATEGASIFYTVDGTEPTIASTEYTEPVVINADTTIKAIAVKEGMTNSDVATAAYTLKVIALNVATFDFTAPATLGDYPASAADAKAAYEADNEGAIAKDGGNDNYYATLSDVMLNNSNVYIKASKGKNTDARLYYQTANGGASQLRIYTGSNFTIASGDRNNLITKIVINLSNTTNGFPETSPYTFAKDNKTLTFENAGGAQEVHVEGLTANMQIKSIEVTCEKELSGVENITVADENAPVEYYNLQGVRLNNPVAGQVVIARQGSKVSKLIVR